MVIHTFNQLLIHLVLYAMFTKPYVCSLKISSTDMWGLGCLVWETYNGPLRNRTNLKDINNVSVSITISTIYICFF